MFLGHSREFTEQMMTENLRTRDEDEVDDFKKLLPEDLEGEGPRQGLAF